MPLPTGVAHNCTSVDGSMIVPPDGTRCQCPPLEGYLDGDDYVHTQTWTRPFSTETCTHGPWWRCPKEPTHTYGAGTYAGGRSATLTGGETYARGHITVHDTNVNACDNIGFDGDYDAGIGGAFFGYGAWADDAECNYGLNTHGGNVAIQDLVFGSEIAFLTGEDDQSGPVKVVDAETGAVVCETDGTISPGDASVDPTADSDDCLSETYIGTGATCGSGGGDGGYWVLLLGIFLAEDGSGLTLANPPTSGTITAF